MTYRTAVVGAGIMGAQIAYVLALHNYPVVLIDVDNDAFDRAKKFIEHDRFGVSGAVSSGIIDDDEAKKLLSRITYSADRATAVHDADVVIEAIPELLAEKMLLLRHLDMEVKEDCVIASNTGGLPITALAYATTRPDRVIGWHWSQPVAAMRFAEIIRHSGVSEKTVRLVVEMSQKCGKNPQVITDGQLSWGFVANRIQRRIQEEAALIISEGIATSDQVDILLRDCFGWPLGPIELQNTP